MTFEAEAQVAEWRTWLATPPPEPSTLTEVFGERFIALCSDAGLVVNPEWFEEEE